MHPQLTSQLPQPPVPSSRPCGSGSPSRLQSLTVQAGPMAIRSIAWNSTDCIIVAKSIHTASVLAKEVNCKQVIFVTPHHLIVMPGQLPCKTGQVYSPFLILDCQCMLTVSVFVHCLDRGIFPEISFLFCFWYCPIKKKKLFLVLQSDLTIVSLCVFWFWHGKTKST